MIQPQLLNQTNNKYGKSELSDYACIEVDRDENDLLAKPDFAEYSQRQALKNHGIKSIDDLPNMNEIDLAQCYFVGRAYFAKGDIDGAVAFFQVVYSQKIFQDNMRAFRRFVELAHVALEKIAEDRGEDYVNSVNIRSVFNARLDTTSSACFIATAAYGSPLASEVVTLRQYRDEVLLCSMAGTAFVRIYNILSPPLASIISKSETLRAITRDRFLRPLIWLIKSDTKG